MNMTIRPLTPTERDFTYSQQQEIMEQAGCIGYLRADMGSSGKGFFSTWKNLSLRALDTTKRLLKLIAAAPNIGLNFSPNAV